MFIRDKWLQKEQYYLSKLSNSDVKIYDILYFVYDLTRNAFSKYNIKAVIKKKKYVKSDINVIYENHYKKFQCLQKEIKFHQGQSKKPSGKQFLF